MKAKLRELLMECIADGIKTGIHDAYKLPNKPGDEDFALLIDESIWENIDTWFDFEE